MREMAWNTTGFKVRHGLVQKLASTLLALIVTVCSGFLLLGCSAVPAIAPTNADSGYEQRPIHNPDGIGKFYLGREIAQVMGHQGAGWLERSSRETEEQPQRLINALNLKPTDVVADIGAGTGYFSFRIAPLVPQGKVLAVDVQPEMIEILESLKQEKQIANVETVLGSVSDPNLGQSQVDLAIMVDAYHEFEYPKEMMAAIAHSLTPNGRVVLVEYRGEDLRVLIKPLHKMTQKQVRKEMTAVGLTWLETKNILPQQHVMIFGKKLSSSKNRLARDFIPDEADDLSVSLSDNLPVSSAPYALLDRQMTLNGRY